MGTKGNVVLYLDKELVSKSKELGFNLSKTFENHLRRLMTQFSTSNSLNNLELSSKSRIVAGGEGFEPSTPNLGGWCSIRTELRGSAHFRALLLAQISRPAHFSKFVGCYNSNVQVNEQIRIFFQIMVGCYNNCLQV